MNAKITTVLGLVAGFIGGAMSHYLFVPMPVRAQAPVQVLPEIRAQKFVLVDESGEARGVFGLRNNGTPDLQVRFDKPKGPLKFLSAEVGSARWEGVTSEKNMLPDLRPAQPPKTTPPAGSE
ncbi:MAG TPA: hypothetical protein VKB88_39100 [Bryobacteraceae bacterium]|nr:hypothetical protein [Bryobacteraceae bacterium]